MIEARVRRTVVERGLFGSGERVVVACSGGADSAALAHALVRLAPAFSLHLCIASVDHGLRPDAARDVETARALAERLDLPFHPLAVQVGPGDSLQARARAARYGALLGLARAEGARRVAVGHTLDDQAETVLGRLLRGAGVDGLAGIAPRRADGVVRPLLDCRRHAVRAYAAEHELPVVEDPSNRDRRFSRVRLRLDVLPALEAEDPRVIEHLGHVADDARAAKAALRSRSRRLLARAADGEGGLERLRVAAAPRAVRRLALAAWLAEACGKRPGRAHLEAVDRAFDQGRGEVLLPDGHCVRIFKQGPARVTRVSGPRGRAERACETTPNAPED